MSQQSHTSPYDVTTYRTKPYDVTMYEHSPAYEAGDDNTSQWLRQQEPIYGRKHVTFQQENSQGQSQGENKVKMAPVTPGTRVSHSPRTSSLPSPAPPETEAPPSESDTDGEGEMMDNGVLCKNDVTSGSDDVILTLDLHGLRRLYAGRNSFCRRFLWIFLLFLASAASCYLIYVEVRKYLTYPMMLYTIPLLTKAPSTDTAVTMCNLNKHRLSELVHRGWLTPLDLLYTSSSPPDSAMAGFNVSSRVVLVASAHRIDHMLVSCLINQSVCGPHNFSTTLTESGVCYTITPPSEIKGDIDLMLNLECYDEHPNSAAGRGVKISLHQQGTFPPRQGATIPAGVKVTVGFDTKTVQLTKMVDVSCDSDVILRSHCEAQCAADAVTLTCGCRAPWLPSTSATGASNIFCNMQKHIQCVDPLLEQMVWEDCRCKSSCDAMTSTLSTSVTAIPDIDLQSVMTSNDLTQVISRYRESQAIRNNLSRSKYKKMAALIEVFSKALDDVTSGYTALRDDIISVSTQVRDMMHEMTSRTSAHMKLGLMGMKKMIENGFLDGWRLIEQRTVTRLPVDFQDAMSQFTRVANKLQYTSSSEKTMRQILYLTLDSELASKMGHAVQAVDNFTQVYYAFLNGEPLSNHLVTPGRRYDDVLIPLNILVENTEKQHDFFNGLIEILRGYIQQLIVLQSLLKEVYLKSSMNESAYATSQEFFRENRDSLSFHVHMFSQKIVQKVSDVIEHHMLTFKKANHSMYSAHVSCQHLLDMTADRLGSEFQLVQMKMLSFRQLAQDYVISGHVTTAKELTESGLSEELQMAMLHMQEVSWELSHQGRELNKTWDQVRASTQKVWQEILHDSSLRNFYSRVNNDVNDMVQNPLRSRYFTNIFLHPKMLDVSEEDLPGLTPEMFFTLLNADAASFTLEEKMTEVSLETERLSGQSSVSHTLLTAVNKLTLAYEELRNDLRSLRLSTAIDPGFVRKNLVQIRVKRENRVPSVMHEASAYPIIHLIRDCAVILVIFLGASILTIFELIEICICGLFCRNKCTKTPKKVNRNSPDECDCQQQGSLLHETRTDKDQTVIEDTVSPVTYRTSNHVSRNKEPT